MFDLRLRSLRLPALAAALALTACDQAADSLAPSETVPNPPSLAQAPNTWIQKVSLPAIREGLVAATVTGRIYAIGGVSGQSISRIVGRYDPANGGVWASMAPLPAPRLDPSGATVINGKIYVPGGRDTTGANKKSLFVYNPGTNTWATKAAMPVPSFAGASGAINGKLYVVSPGAGGAKLHQYDPATNVWTARAAPPHNLSWPAAEVINGKLYLAGGLAGEGSPAAAVLDVYDPSTNSWQTRAKMPTARYAAAARVLGGKLYVVGGTTGYPSFGSLAAVEAYDPGTNSWTKRAGMPTARGYLAAAVVNGVLYALGGHSGTVTVAANEAYAP